MYEMTTLFPAELIVNTVQTAAVYAAAAGHFVLTQNPMTVAGLIGGVIGFVFGCCFGGPRSAGCSFCCRPGKINGVYVSDDDIRESKHADFCPVCGRKLRR